MDALIKTFFDAETSTATHVVACPATGCAAVIDSVFGYDPKSGRSFSTPAEPVRQHVQSNRLQVQWHLETHAHADHLSGAPWLQARLGGKIAIGRGICEVQSVFKRIFNAADMATDGRPFDRLFDDGEAFRIGALEARVMHTPGHTPACVSYLIGADAFVGDTLFMPDYGSARCDFPGGDARTLYRSIHKLLALPADTRLHLCHDYPPEQRPPRWVTSVAEQRAGNVHVHDGIDEDAFVAMRTARDRTLGMPTLLLPAIQVNVRAGRLPPAEGNGVVYLKIPIDRI